MKTYDKHFHHKYLYKFKNYNGYYKMVDTSKIPASRVDIDWDKIAIFAPQYCIFYDNNLKQFIKWQHLKQFVSSSES